MAFCSQIKEQKSLSCLPLASEMYWKKGKFVFLSARATIGDKMADLWAANRWQRACGLLAGFSFPGSQLRFGAQPLTVSETINHF